MPPCSWTVSAVTVRYASEHQACATEAASARAPGAPSASTARTTAERLVSTCTSRSAQACLTAWKLPIARPNCRRSLT